MQKIKLKKLFYNGKWNKPLSKKTYKYKSTTNFFFEIPSSNLQDLNNCIFSAKKGLENYQKFSTLKKSRLLKKISKIIRGNINTLALNESLELGKNYESCKKEILACSNLWLHASKQIKKKRNKIIKKKNTLLYEIEEPVGIVALIIPWNFPMIVLSERLPYILAAGNSVVIKPSENGNSSIEKFIRLIDKLGLPKGLINFLTGGSDLGKKLIKNKNISMISFTGSTKSGKQIYKDASSDIKRLSLELGGKNPMIIFSDANIDKASNDVIYSFIHNAGQCCVSGSKLYIEKKVFNIFLKKIKQKLDNIKLFQGTATINQYKKIKKIILKSIKERIPIAYKRQNLFDDKKRLIYPIIFKPKKRMSYLEDEIFGPVLTIFPFSNFQHLVKDINNTEYGLSALIWGKNRKKILNFASKIKFGRIWLNGNISQNYPQISIGGFKSSGLNRETGDSGIKTYSEIKSIVENI